MAGGTFFKGRGVAGWKPAIQPTGSRRYGAVCGPGFRGWPEGFGQAVSVAGCVEYLIRDLP